MRCRSCDYPLWRSTRRACTECGAPYAVADYRFRRGAVAFRCPHCSTRYYGTSVDGHLEPNAFTCVGCGNAITMEETSIEPAAGVDEDRTGFAPNPWLHRRGSRLLAAWARSVISILGGPSRFVRSIPTQSPVGDAVLFAGVTATLSAVFTLVLVLVVLVAQVAVSGFTGGGALLRDLALQVSAAAVNTVLAIVAALVAGFVAHLVLVVLRAAPGGLARSLQPILYAQGAANALNLAFCTCGPALAPIWWCVAMARMLHVAQQASLWKTTVASIVAAIVWIAASGAAFLATAGWTTAGIAAAATPFIATIDAEDLFGDADAFEDPFTALADGALGREAFIELVAGPEGTRIGPMSVQRFRTLDDDELRRFAESLRERLPADDAFYRLGRAIFVHRSAHGDRRAWLVVRLSPEAAAAQGADGPMQGRTDILRRIGHADSSGTSFADRLATENERRRAAGKPLLPDPRTLPDLLASPSDILNSGETDGVPEGVPQGIPPGIPQQDVGTPPATPGS
jgi:hypothetical protein